MVISDTSSMPLQILSASSLIPATATATNSRQASTSFMQVHLTASCASHLGQVLSTPHFSDSVMHLALIHVQLPSPGELMPATPSLTNGRREPKDEDSHPLHYLGREFCDAFHKASRKSYNTKHQSPIVMDNTTNHLCTGLSFFLVSPLLFTTPDPK